jgi:DNA binding domain, excisionase family
VDLAGVGAATGGRLFLHATIEFYRVQTMKHRDHFTIAEGAKLVGRSPVTIRYWAQRGHIGAYKSGGTWLINRHDLEWAARNRKPRPATKPATDHAGGRKKERTT